MREEIESEGVHHYPLLFVLLHSLVFILGIYCFIIGSNIVYVVVQAPVCLDTVTSLPPLLL